MNSSVLEGISPESFADLSQTFKELSEKQIRAVAGLLGFDEPELADINANERLRTHVINELLDRHGTGRVLFRNTRSAVQGFPERELHAYPLECPDEYLELPLGEHADLYPEVSYQAQPEINNDEDYLNALLKMYENHPVNENGKPNYPMGVYGNLKNMGGYRASFLTDVAVNLWSSTYFFKSSINKF